MLKHFDCFKLIIVIMFRIVAIIISLYFKTIIISLTNSIKIIKTELIEDYLMAIKFIKDIKSIIN